MGRPFRPRGVRCPGAAFSAKCAKSVAMGFLSQLGHAVEPDPGTTGASDDVPEPVESMVIPGPSGDVRVQGCQRRWCEGGRRRPAGRRVEGRTRLGWAALLPPVGPRWPSSGTSSNLPASRLLPQGLDGGGSGVVMTFPVAFLTF